MITISKEYVTDILKVGQNPAVSCKSGDIVRFITKDCYDDNDISVDCPMGNHVDALENPATGPLFIEEAQIGDILKVEILDIKLRDYGIMRSSTESGPLHTLYQTREARIFPIQSQSSTQSHMENISVYKDGGSSMSQNGVPSISKDGVPSILFDETLSIPCDAMIGVIGTAPKGDGVVTITPGTHGGNMDCTQITVGATVYLPVNTQGALLSIGDLHAKMGDGEVFICGLEIGGEVTVRVSVLKSACDSSNHIPYPFVVNRGVCMTIQAAPTLDEACDKAVLAMEAFLHKTAGIDDLKAGMLMSLLCNMVICQVVNTLKTVRAEFPLDVLQAYGVVLP